MAAATAVTAAAVAPPALADAPGTLNSPPRTGERIRLLSPPATYPAGTAFYILTGYADGTVAPEDNWGLEMQVATADGLMSGLTHVDLFVDGEQVAGVEDLGFTDTYPYPVLKGDLFNFRDGLPAGPHTFTANFYWLGEFLTSITATVPFT